MSLNLHINLIVNFLYHKFFIFYFPFAESIRQLNHCSASYGGPFAFSEPETKNIRDYVLQLNPTPIVALCLHSFSQYWLYPYGYDQTHVPENVDELVSTLVYFTNLGFH